jgi:anaerobic selenocysteine-containing dehydrogenase
MPQKISRRDFLKIAGPSAAATAVLAGCGPASRYVVRQPYYKMPEYTYNGQSTYYATTCRECPAACGIVVRTMQGRALKIEGNKDHPVSLGKTCSRGQAALQGLYNPDRLQGPAERLKRGADELIEMGWEAAIDVVAKALQSTSPNEIAFLLGPAPDHLFDLVTELTQELGAPPPVRYSTYATFDARATLIEASKRLFNAPSLPFFDIANADVTFSFGANFLETYLSPVAYARGFAHMRRGHPNRRGYFVHFEPRLSQTAATADEWIAIRPGSEGLVALALGRLIAEQHGAIPNAFLDVDVATVAGASDVSEEDLHRLAELFATAEHPLAVPGGAVMGQTSGVEAAEAVLSLNILSGNLGQEGGVFLTPPLLVHQENAQASSSLLDLHDLIPRMGDGKVKVLFVHGTNPLFELPPSMGFSAALENVPQVISFASFPDETALQADYVFPDHTFLEAWGYQRVATGGDRPVISGAQPVVVPVHDTRSTADVLLAAAQAAGQELPYQDEVEFIQQVLVDLVQEDGFFNAPEIRTFMAKFQQHGGWWAAAAGLEAPETAADVLNQSLHLPTPELDGEGLLTLFPFPSPILGDGRGANKPWLQETPDPMTTVMWNTWVEINPDTADELGLEDDDVVKISSPHGEIEAVVYRYPAIRPDIIAIPFGQGHTAYGRYAQGRGANPVHLFGLKINGAGDLAFAANKVDIEKVGRRQPIARLESRLGVYGDGLEEHQ